MKKVCMILTDGFEEIEAVGTYAILRRGGLSVDIYSLLDQDATGRFGLTCTKLNPFSQLNAADYAALVIPGGPEYKALEASPAVQALIKTFIEAGKVVAAICAGPTLLGHAGYLKGKNYTLYLYERGLWRHLSRRLCRNGRQYCYGQKCGRHDRLCLCGARSHRRARNRRQNQKRNLLQVLITNEKPRVKAGFIIT